MAINKVTQEIVMCFWEDDVLKSIERKNGHLERHMTTPANWGDSVEQFGAETENIKSK